MTNHSEVSQRARDAAWPHRPPFMTDTVATVKAWNEGRYDDQRIVQAFARFEAETIRLTHQALPDRGAVCPDCGGHGEYFGHGPGCDNDNCALAGGIDDCDGEVVQCHCSTTPAEHPAGEVERVRALLEPALRKADDDIEVVRVGNLRILLEALSPPGVAQEVRGSDVSRNDPLGFRAWLAFSINAARYNRDALDPKAAEILENVLARFDECATLSPDRSPTGLDTGEVVHPLDTAPKDDSYYLLVGDNFDGGMAVVNWDASWGDDGWWMLDDGKNFEIPVRGDSKLKGWLPLPALRTAAETPGAEG